MPTQRYAYDRPQRAFHWIMALLMLIALAIGAWAYFLPPKTPVRHMLLFWHKSLGMALLVLVVLRMLYRAVAGAPAYRAPLDRLTRGAAHAGHALLYLLMLAMPATGYVMSAAGGYPLPFFGLFDWPRLVEKSEAAGHAAGGAHYWAAWAMAAVIAVHIAAAVWHHRVRRDEVMSRMLPERPASA